MSFAVDSCKFIAIARKDNVDKPKLLKLLNKACYALWTSLAKLTGSDTDCH
jgi:hypothetical protein